MYICKCCHAVSAPHQKRLVHFLYKFMPDPRTGRDCRQIAAEVPVCRRCKMVLERGASVRDLIQQFITNAPAGPTPELAPTPVPAPVGQPVSLSGVVIRPTAPAKPAKAPPKPLRPKCDVCGADATGGQVTADTTLCPEHMVALHGAVKDLVDKTTRHQSHKKNGRGPKK